MYTAAGFCTLYRKKVYTKGFSYRLLNIFHFSLVTLYPPPFFISIALEWPINWVSDNKGPPLVQLTKQRKRANLGCMLTVLTVLFCINVSLIFPLAGDLPGHLLAGNVQLHVQPDDLLLHEQQVDNLQFTLHNLYDDK